VVIAAVWALGVASDAFKNWISGSRGRRGDVRVGGGGGSKRRGRSYIRGRRTRWGKRGGRLIRLWGWRAELYVVLQNPRKGDGGSIGHIGLGGSKSGCRRGPCR